jgi:magnesium chelatase family protein
VEQYWRRFSAPLLDRIDLRVPVFPGETSAAEKRFALPDGTDTAAMRDPIGRAIQLQRSRQGKRNRFLAPEEIRRFCPIPPDLQALLDRSAQVHNLSARAAASCIKLARTIADMESSASIKIEHLEEAVFFRKNEGVLSFDF